MSLANPAFHAPLEEVSALGWLSEVRTLADVARMSVAMCFSRTARAARPQPVMVLPGFGGDDWWTWPLRRTLAAAGHRAEGWGLGRNLAGVDIPHSEDDIRRHWHVERLSHYRGEGCVILLCERLLTRVRRRHAELGEPLALVGWSLGGYLAREVAREAPECVSRVVTLGSPVVGGPKYTLAASFFRERGMNLDWIEQEVAKREARPIDVPITAIVSGTDGVVHPPATVDLVNARVRHVEIDAPHLGLVFNPQVWALILDALYTVPER